jgi:hypothetical protein
MVNLLTKAAKSSLTLTYYTRLATLFFMLLAFVSAASVAMLLPSYFSIHAEVDDAARYVKALSDIADQHAKGQAAETLSVFTDTVHLLGSSNHDPVLGKILLLTTGVVPKGVSVDSLDASAEPNGTVKVTVSGVAATRASLLTYSDNLKAVHTLSGVTVPVSALVSEINNDYSIQMLYTPTKTP